jgi:hypothetical protein
MTQPAKDLTELKLNGSNRHSTKPYISARQQK